uniref:Uncharacterized protein n=1 Tax=Anabas testudineus TaxID=64144 RepID=A0A3Q1JDL3_ANATE
LLLMLTAPSFLVLDHEIQSLLLVADYVVLSPESHKITLVCQITTPYCPRSAHYKSADLILLSQELQQLCVQVGLVHIRHLIKLLAMETGLPKEIVEYKMCLFTVLYYLQ